MLQQHFYDEQIKRYLLQIIRLFSNFQVQTGIERDGNAALMRVPARYGDASRQASVILRQNSESGTQTVPMISCYVDSLDYNPEWRQDPTFVDSKHLRERKYNTTTESYETTQGNAFTVDRFMPAPYNLMVKVDIWTSNTDQKLQLLEQILCLFNPSLELQSTDNYLDWTSLSILELQNVQWTSRSVPMGGDDQIDVATLSFKTPIWISMPAKVKKLGVIYKIIASMYDEDGQIPQGILTDDILLGNRQTISPLDAGVLLLGNQVKLLRVQETLDIQNDEIGSPSINYANTAMNWDAFINQYGELTGGITQLKFNQDPNEIEVFTEVVGTVAYHPTDKTVLLFTVDTDTIPTNTQTAVLSIVNPTQVGPGTAGGLAAATSGQRYLILEDIGDASNTDGADAWKGTGGEELIASANDIIAYDGTEWTVDFDASANGTTVQYVTNTTSGIQYKWSTNQWIKSYEGEYSGGHWSVVL
jgi:hypothetical protein